MASRSNFAATRRMVRALREAERLDETTAGFVQLALSAAADYDEARRADTPAYALAQLNRTHREALAALVEHARPVTTDAMDKFLADLATAGPGTEQEWHGQNGSSWSSDA
jgi:hypothetical protein